MKLNDILTAVGLPATPPRTAKAAAILWGRQARAAVTASRRREAVKLRADYVAAVTAASSDDETNKETIALAVAQALAAIPFKK